MHLKKKKQQRRNMKKSLFFENEVICNWTLTDPTNTYCQIIINHGIFYASESVLAGVDPQYRKADIWAPFTVVLSLPLYLFVCLIISLFIFNYLFIFNRPLHKTNLLTSTVGLREKKWSRLDNKIVHFSRFKGTFLCWKIKYYSKCHREWLVTARSHFEHNFVYITTLVHLPYIIWIHIYQHCISRHFITILQNSAI